MFRRHEEKLVQRDILWMLIILGVNSSRTVNKERNEQRHSFLIHKIKPKPWMEYDLVHKQSMLSLMVLFNHFPIHSPYKLYSVRLVKPFCRETYSSTHYAVKKNYTDTGKFELIVAVHTQK